MNTQDAFTKALAAAAQRLGCDLSVDLEFSNVGIYRMRLAGTLEQMLAVSFEFHLGRFDGRATFRIGGTSSTDEITASSPKLQSALDQIVTRLQERCPKRLSDKAKIQLLRAALREYVERQEHEGDPTGLPEYVQAQAALDATHE